ncbi:MAG: T9SS type A sorting domain-containing protein [Bacteroidetes bacterium]|nr:T9SS type A sorting domain-containing protein [Bacteroidota bacterium]
MKKVLLPMMAIACGVSTFAQTKTFAITSEKKGEFTWTAIRELDFSTGEYTKTLFTKSAQQNLMMRGTNGNAVNNQSFINGRGVAAAAFDKNTNRLYFSEMYGNTLKFVDIANSTTGSLSVGENNDARFSTGTKKVDESNVITRMAFTNEGIGYALTNDASSLIKFTTGANATVTNLGAINDSKKNKDISIHTQCTSWGGDMIGDIYGNLYLVTMRNNVFKININKMEAEFVGTIKNLPATFTTNGAAADDDGNILLSSASNADSYFKVNASTLEAVAIKGGKDMYNVSDLANSNLVYQRKPIASNAAITTAIAEVSIYPNPAVGKTFNVSLNKLDAGNYNMILTDVNGKSVLTKQININGLSMENVVLPKAATAGIYMLRVVDNNGKTVSTNRIVIQ